MRGGPRKRRDHLNRRHPTHWGRLLRHRGSCTSAAGRALTGALTTTGASARSVIDFSTEGNHWTLELLLGGRREHASACTEATSGDELIVVTGLSHLSH